MSDLGFFEFPSCCGFWRITARFVFLQQTFFNRMYIILSVEAVSSFGLSLLIALHSINLSLLRLFFSRQRIKLLCHPDGANYISCMIERGEKWWWLKRAIPQGLISSCYFLHYLAFFFVEQRCQMLLQSIPTTPIHNVVVSS